MANIGLLTIGVLKAPYYEPQIASLGELLEPVWAAAEASRGFLGYSKGDAAHVDRHWGPMTIPPRFQPEAAEARLLAILSLWTDLESAVAFSYNGLHARALSRRAEWFVPQDAPGYVAWWVADDQTPTWAEACERYDQLHQRGATAAAFTFKQPFSADGQPIELNRATIKSLTAQET